MNRQEIADRLEALNPKYEELRKAAAAGLDAEKASLQAACGEMGHVYRLTMYSGGFRHCVVCDARETGEAYVLLKARTAASGVLTVDGSLVVAAKSRTSGD